MLFSEKYRNTLQNNNNSEVNTFCPEIDEKTKESIVDILYNFDEIGLESPYRYNNYTIQVSTIKEVEKNSKSP